MNERLFTAYHEAGHVIIALLNNCFVESCFIKSGSGLVVYYQYNNQKLSRNKECQVSFAGFLAESFLYYSLYETDFPTYLKKHSSIDLAKIYYLTKRYDLNKQNIKIITNKKISNHWNEICLIANLLLEKSTLSTDDIYQALTKTRNKKFWIKRINLINKKYNKAS